MLTQLEKMETLKSKQSLFVGSSKNGFMSIGLGESVNAVKQNANSVYIEKNGITKRFNKSMFE